MPSIYFHDLSTFDFYGLGLCVYIFKWLANLKLPFAMSPHYVKSVLGVNNCFMVLLFKKNGVNKPFPTL